MSYSPKTRKRAKSIFKQIESCFANSEFDSAIELIYRLQEDYLSHFDSWYLGSWLGICHFANGNYSEAITALEESRNKIDQAKVIKYGINYLQVLEYLGCCYFKIENYITAIKRYDEAEKYIPYCEKGGFFDQLCYFRIGKARVYLWLKRYKEALHQYELAWKTLPDDGSDKESEAVLNYEIGKTYYYQEEQEKASKQLSAVMEKNLPDAYLPEFYLLMTKNLNKTENYKRVLDYIEKIENIGTPEIWAAEFYNLAGRAHYFLRNFTESERCFLKSNEFPPEHDWISQHNSHFLKLLKTIELEN